jgi:uncharacterized protein YqgV (UPF0045/DUF77 family)
MVVSTQVSIYPLRQERLSPAIRAVQERPEATGLRPEVGAMSTMVGGEDDAVLGALQEASQEAAAGQVVLTITASNACPI